MSETREKQIKRADKVMRESRKLGYAVGDQITSLMDKLRNEAIESGESDVDAVATSMTAIPVMLAEMIANVVSSSLGPLDICPHKLPEAYDHFVELLMKQLATGLPLLRARTVAVLLERAGERKQ